MREMKDSGIAWVGTMPDTWNTKRGKHTLKLLNRAVEDTDEVITCFRDGEVTLRKNRREDGFTVSLKEIGYQGIEPGDLVIHGMDGFAGAIGISDSRGKSSPVLVVCDSDENKRFIMYYLRSMAYNDVFTALATGIRVRSCDLRWNKLAELPYILPSIKEQEAIVHAIESDIKKINALISNVQAQIEKLKAYKRSVITEVVLNGFDSTVPMKDSGIDWLGKVPSTYNLVKLNTICKMITDGTHVTPEYLDEGYPFLSIKDISSGKIDFSNVKYISKDEHEALYKSTPVEKGDMLFTRIGTLGVFIIVDTDEVFDIFVSVGLIKFNDEIDLVSKKYIKYYFSTTQFNNYIQLVKAGGETSAAKFNLGDVRNSMIAMPGKIEQQEIVDYLDAKCSKIDELIAIKQGKIEKLEQYKKSLIYEYVTGKKEVI